MKGTFRLPKTTFEVDATPVEPEAPPPDQPIPRVRSGSVLVVEDSYILAMDLESMLTEMGCENVTVVGTLAGGQRTLDESRFDFAILDINLRGQLCFPLASQLYDEGVPFIFTSGYGDRIAIPEEYQHVPLLTKPITRDIAARHLAKVASIGFRVQNGQDSRP